MASKTSSSRTPARMPAVSTASPASPTSPSRGSRSARPRTGRARRNGSCSRAGLVRRPGCRSSTTPARCPAARSARCGQPWVCGCTRRTRLSRCSSATGTTHASTRTRTCCVSRRSAAAEAAQAPQAAGRTFGLAVVLLRTGKAGRGGQMRRWILAAVVVGFAVSTVPAQAEPGVPRHHHSETRPIAGVVRSVVVSGDYSNIAVTTGPRTVVTATEAWNFTQPKLSVSLSHKVLKIDIRCDDGTSLADTVFLDGGNLLNDCTDDLRLTVPVRVALRAKTYLGNVSAQGVHGVQRLRSGAGSITVRDGGGRSV